MKTKELHDVYGDTITVAPAGHEVRVRTYAPGASPTKDADDYEVFFFTPEGALRLAKALQKAARHAAPIAIERERLYG